jgi:hypothetical protein
MLVAFIDLFTHSCFLELAGPGLVLVITLRVALRDLTMKLLKENMELGA